MSRVLSSLVNPDGSNVMGSRGYGTASSTIPTKPLSPYILFVKSEFPKQPSTKPMDAMKSLSTKWKSMSEQEKTPWLTQSSVAQEEYNRAMARVDPKVLEAHLLEKSKAAKEKRVKKTSANLTKVIRESGIPKRPVSSFNLFTQKMNQSSDIKILPDFKAKNQRVVGMWKNLNPAEVKYWQNQLEQAKKTYEVEIAKWRAANPDKVKAIEAARESRSKAIAATKPPKPIVVKKKVVAKKVEKKAAPAAPKKKAVAAAVAKKPAAKPKAKAKAKA